LQIRTFVPAVKGPGGISPEEVGMGGMQLRRRLLVVAVALAAVVVVATARAASVISETT
jgi:hypothetical protein